MRGLTPNDIGRGRESYRRPVATRRRRVRCSRSVTGRRPVSRTSHLMALFQGTEAPGPKLNAPRQKSAPLTHVRGALVLCWRFYKAMEFCGPFVRLWASPTSSVFGQDRFRRRLRLFTAGLSFHFGVRKESADGFVIVDATDGLGEDRGDGERLDFAVLVD